MLPLLYRVTRVGPDKYRLVFREFAEADMPIHRKAKLAEAAALEDIVSVLQGRIKGRMATPVSTDNDWRHDGSVTLPLLLQMKISLCNGMQKHGIKRADLAKRMNSAGPTIDRLFDVHHNNRIDIMEAALAAVGLRVVVSISPSA